MMMMSLVADKSVEGKFKRTMNFVKEISNPPCKSLLTTFFELSFEACEKRASSCLKTLVRPKRTLSQLFELLFPLLLLMSLRRKLLEREERRVRWEVPGTNWISRCVRDGGWYEGRCGGRKSWCCWRCWRGWGLWVRVWMFHALKDPSSGETYQESCVRGCRWRRSPSTLWVFKSSAFTINLSIRFSLLASHWIL